MRLGFVINRFATLSPTYTTTHIAYEAYLRRHVVVLLNTDGFERRSDGSVWGQVRGLAPGRVKTREEFAQALREQGGHLSEKMDLSSLDVVFLRNNPANGDVLNFACCLKHLGVVVLNDPETLVRANSKMYMTSFPEDIQPRTLISKDARAIKDFLRDLDTPAILKPLNGFGGEHILYVRRRQKTNLNAYIEALARVNGGYVVAQEYLPAAKKGDKRILLLDGEIIGAYNRVHASDDIRNNIHSGGRARYAPITDEDRRVCARLKPRVLEDRLYLVGVDKIGDKILEVNVFAPGGINNINLMSGSNLGRRVVEDLETKVLLRKAYRHRDRLFASA